MLLMKARAIVLLMCIKGVCSAPCTTNPVAEGSTTVITQTVPKTNVTDGNIKWRFTNAAGSDITVIECNIDDNPPCISSLLGENVYSGTMLTSGSNYRVTLTVHNVNRVRDQTTWTWTSRTGDDSVIGQCDLDVYSFQSAPVCQTLGISSDGYPLWWTCTVSNVYPEMECRFKIRSGSKSYQRITQNVDIQKTTTDGKYPPRTVYHDYTCTMNLLVSQLGGEGTYQFRFTADVVNESSTLKTSSPIVKDLNLAYPRVELVGCPNADDSTQGYISEKDNKTCQCRLKEAGNPPGVAQWRNAQGILVGQNGSLSLVYNPDDPAPTYTCRGYSILGTGPTITYKPKFVYTPTVTEYKANSHSSELTVSDGDTVTFVCNAVGDPRPSVSVRGQRWDGVITLQYTLSGPYVIESSGTKNMSCKDTDVYTCMADNGVGGGLSNYLYVFVECAPELSFTSFIQNFSTLNGTNLKIEIPIIGFPEPQSYSLEKVSDNYRRKRAVIAKDIGEHKYFVIYIPDNPPKGVVVLMILGMIDEDDGQYKLTIDNGIKDGLDYSFSVSILSEENNPSDDDNNIVIGLVIGWVVAVVLIASLCLVLVIVKVRTNRWVKERQSLQRQIQQQQHEIQEQQQQLQEHRHWARQLPRLPTQNEETELNEYDGLNILDTQEQDNMYQHIGSQYAKERQTPATGTRDGDSTEQEGGFITRQGFQTDPNHKSDVGPSSNYKNDTESDTGYVNQDFPEGFKEPVAMTTDTDEAIDDSHLYLELMCNVTEANESHRE